MCKLGSTWICRIHDFHVRKKMCNFTGCPGPSVDVSQWNAWKLFGPGGLANVQYVMAVMAPLAIQLRGESRHFPSLWNLWIFAGRLWRNESCVDPLAVRQFTLWLCMAGRKIGVMTVMDISSYIYFVVRVFLVMLWLRFHDVPWLIAVHQKNSRLTIETGAGWCTVLLNAGWT